MPGLRGIQASLTVLRPGTLLDSHREHVRCNTPVFRIDGTSSPDIPPALIVDNNTFTSAAELAIRQAIRFRHCVSLLALHAGTEPDNVHIESTELHRRVAESIRHEIRDTDLVCTTVAPPPLRVLLVEATLENLPAIIARFAAAVNCRHLDSEKGGVRVTLSIGGACFPRTAASRVDLFRQAELLSVEGRAQPGRFRHRYRLAQPVS
jgi:hypothetical protein